MNQNNRRILLVMTILSLIAIVSLAFYGCGAETRDPKSKGTCVSLDNYCTTVCSEYSTTETMCKTRGDSACTKIGGCGCKWQEPTG